MQTSLQNRLAVDELLPLADRISAFASISSRAAAFRDAGLATELLASGGDCDRCASAVASAWADHLASQNLERSGQTKSLEFLVSLEKIVDLAKTVCERVIGLSGEEPVGDVPSIRRLAELVPEMLFDALCAVRANDRPSAQKVLDRSIAADACFAQVQLDLLQIAKDGGTRMDTARQFHALGRALERMGDNASDIAAKVRRPLSFQLES